MTLCAHRLGDLHLLTWLPDGPSSDLTKEARSAYREVLSAVGDAEIVMERIFGDLDAAPCVLAARQAELGHSAGARPAPTYVAGSPITPTRIAGVHVIAVRPAAQTSGLNLGDPSAPCGRLVHGSTFSCLALSGVAPGSPAQAPAIPERVVAGALQTASDLLASVGWSFSNIVRTWFHLDGILTWYDAFNCARTSTFDRLGLADDRAVFPASTAVGGEGAAGTPCTFDLLAVKRSDARAMNVRRLHNPCQGEARAYGSAFSRGVAVPTGQGTVLFVSGTAAIDEQGTSLHRGDFESQVIRTVDTVRELLASEGASLHSIRQATAFVKRPADAHLVQGALRRAGWPGEPPVSTLGDICRDELLFELDATAFGRTDQD